MDEALRTPSSLDVVYSDGQNFGNPAPTGKTYMQTCPSNSPVALESLIKDYCYAITSNAAALNRAVVVQDSPTRGWICEVATTMTSRSASCTTADG